MKRFKRLFWIHSQIHKSTHQNNQQENERYGEEDNVGQDAKVDERRANVPLGFREPNAADAAPHEFCAEEESARVKKLVNVTAWCHVGDGAARAYLHEKKLHKHNGDHEGQVAQKVHVQQCDVRTLKALLILDIVDELGHEPHKAKDELDEAREEEVVGGFL